MALITIGNKCSKILCTDDKVKKEETVIKGKRTLHIRQ